MFDIIKRPQREERRQSFYDREIIGPILSDDYIELSRKPWRALKHMRAIGVVTQGPAQKMHLLAYTISLHRGLVLTGVP
jgi:hypothetical protein